ncbi:MAG: TIGR03435 family protein [Verrucomicrobiia bacterium]
MKSWVCLLLFAACLSEVRATSLPDGPQVGQVAPALKLSKWLQAPPEASQGWPTGKVVVLEFWATSCGPCVAYIPHMNELADEFKDKPVQFIAVTDEKESGIMRFLKKTPIHAWLGLGPDGGLGENTPYRVMAIPHTVIIDAHGRIAAITEPFVLQAATIQACLDGSPGSPAGGQTSVTNPVSSRIVTTEYWTSDGGQLPGMIPAQYLAGIKPMFQVMIRPTPTNSTTASPRTNQPPALNRRMSDRPVETWSARAMTAQNDTLERAIEIVFAVKPNRVVADAELPTNKYDFYITLPPGNRPSRNQTNLEAVFAQAVAASFDLTVQREMRNIDVWVLKTNAASLETLSKSTNPDGKYSAFWNEAAATNQPLSALAEELEISGAKLVLNETGLTNHYDFDIKWTQKDYSHPNIAGMIDAVKTLGLELVPEKRSMEVVVVRKVP